MSNITPLFLMNTTIVAEAGRTYQFVDVQGKPLTQLSLERKGDSLIVRSENGTEMEIQHYQNAEFVPPKQVETNDKALYSWIKQNNSNENVTAQEIEQVSQKPSLLWWALGGLAVLGSGIALGGRSGGGGSGSNEPAKPNAKLHAVTQDNALNFAESQSTITLTAEIKNLPENARLQLNLDGKPLDLSFTPNGAIFSTNVAGSTLAQGKQLSLEVLSAQGEVLATSNLDYK